MPKIGAHVSAAVSLDLSFKRAEEIGAECTQIFISPPQQWAKTLHSETEIQTYREQAKKTRIGPNFIHGVYLINLASGKPELVQKSIDWLIYSQEMAEKLGAEGTIFHIGSAGSRGQEEAIKQVIKAISQILEHSQTNLILETSAGAGNTIGDTFQELGQIIKGGGDRPVKIYLDTQHIFASGYDIRTKEGLDKVVGEFDKEIGLDKLVAVHANDSKTELGSHKDRHENIGEGLIGKEAFRDILNHPTFKDLPFILEVPGFTNSGSDQDNIKILKSLLSTS